MHQLVVLYSPLLHKLGVVDYLIENCPYYHIPSWYSASHTSVVLFACRWSVIHIKPLLKVPIKVFVTGMCLDASIDVIFFAMNNTRLSHIMNGPNLINATLKQWGDFELGYHSGPCRIFIICFTRMGPSLIAWCWQRET